MHKLQEYEQEYNRIKNLFNEALKSNSREEKEYAIREFNESLKGLSPGTFLAAAHEFGATVKWIDMAKALPRKIQQLEKLERLVQIQLDAEDTATIGFGEESVEVDDELLVENRSVVVDEPVVAPEPTDDPRLTAISAFKEAIQLQINRLNARTSEYSWGTIEYVGSFFGASGWSKTDKVTALTNLLLRFDNKDAPELSDKDIAVLLNKTSGDAISPWLEHPIIGAELTELLTTSSNRNQLDNNPQ